MKSHCETLEEKCESENKHRATIIKARLSHYETLIKEHFDLKRKSTILAKRWFDILNEPLLFDEMWEDMWVWHDGKYKQIYEIDYKNETIIFVGIGRLTHVKYEYGKFYRYQIE